MSDRPLRAVVLGGERRIRRAEEQSVESMQSKLDTRACALVIVVYPLLLMLVNNSWVFGDPLAITIDDHIYTGYFFNLQQYLNVFPRAYYGTRLPWILFGYAVHALAAPELAQYLLRLALCYAAAFSLFSIIRVLFSDNFAALIGALLMVTHTGFLSAIGWDYVNGPGIVLILAGTALLTSATRSRHWRWALVCAGAAQAAMVANHVLLVMFVPIELAWYVIIDRRSQRNPVPASLTLLTLGALATLGILGGINWALSGSFFFLAPQATAGVAVAHNPAVWGPRNGSWIRHATGLVFPAIASMAGLILGAKMTIAIRRGNLPPHDIYVALSILQLLIVVGLFVVLEAAGFWLLYYSYYASYLFPFAYIAVAAILARAMASVSLPWRWTISAGAAACLLAFFTPTVTRVLRPCAPGCDLTGVVGATAAVAAILLASAGMTRSVPIIAAAMLSLAIVNISVADTHAFSFPPDPARHEAALTVFDAILAIQPDDRDGALRFWYNARDPLGGIFTAISSAHLWHWTLVSNEFPKLIDPVGSANVIDPAGGANVVVRPGERIVILSSQNNWRTPAERTLTPLGLRAVPVGHTRIRRGPIVFDLSFVELQPIDGGPAINPSTAEMVSVAAATIRTQAPLVVIRTAP